MLHTHANGLPQSWELRSVCRRGYRADRMRGQYTESNRFILKRPLRLRTLVSHNHLDDFSSGNRNLAHEVSAIPLHRSIISGRGFPPHTRRQVIIPVGDILESRPSVGITSFLNNVFPVTRIRRIRKFHISGVKVRIGDGSEDSSHPFRGVSTYSQKTNLPPGAGNVISAPLPKKGVHLDGVVSRKLHVGDFVRVVRGRFRMNRLLSVYCPRILSARYPRRQTDRNSQDCGSPLACV